jgi:acetyl-CoA carboxylase alpha subunit
LAKALNEEFDALAKLDPKKRITTREERFLAIGAE